MTCDYHRDQCECVNADFIESIISYIEYPELSLYTTSDAKRIVQPICTRNISIFLIPAECVTATN